MWCFHNIRDCFPKNGENTTYWMSCNFCYRYSFSTNFFLLERPRLLTPRFCHKYFTNIFVGLVRAKTPTLKMTKFRVRLASRTKPTKAAMENIFPKINSSSVELSNKKKFMENGLLEQKLQLTQYEVFHPNFDEAKFAGLIDLSCGFKLSGSMFSSMIFR